MRETSENYQEPEELYEEDRQDLAAEEELLYLAQSNDIDLLFQEAAHDLDLIEAGVL